MSSFLINKKEFIKCAGFIYGMSQIRNRYENIFYLYSKTHRCLITEEIIKAEFTKLYQANAKSIAIQYDERMYSDDNTYDDIFAEYVERGKKPENTTIVNVLEIIQFLNSVRYQIEDEQCEKTFFNIANKYYRALYKVIIYVGGYRDSLESWGSFEI